MLHSRHPDPPITPPGLGWGVPLHSGRRAPLLAHPRHKPAAWYTVSKAAEAMLQAKGWFQEGRRSWEPLGETRDTPKPLLGEEERPNATEWAASGGHHPIHHSLGMGKRPFSRLGEEGNQHTEHKTFRVGSERAANTPGRRWAALARGLFGTAGGPASSPHPTGATHEGGCCPSPEVWHRGTPGTPLTLPCVQWAGQL